jgi:hypothetical protein
MVELNWGVVLAGISVLCFGRHLGENLGVWREEFVGLHWRWRKSVCKVFGGSYV